MTYQPIAENHAASSENRIHSDDIAKQYGFTGALVPGVAVFGYMSHEMTNRFGVDWLGHSIAEVRLIKPAYDGERLTIDMKQDGESRYQTDCRNDAGSLLATLTVEVPAQMPPIDIHASMRRDEPDPPRDEICWSAIHVEEPFSTFIWTPDAAENNLYTEYVTDDLPVYAAGVLHPHLIQRMANMVLVRRYILPAWVHVSTEMRFRRILRVGDAIELRTIPIDKWERKGHEFIKLYIAYVVDGTPAAEAYHTAIFKLADRIP